MTLDDKNQNDILNSELMEQNDIEFIFSDKPINRFKTKPILEDKDSQLLNLRDEIANISNCELKNSATNLAVSYTHLRAHET